MRKPEESLEDFTVRAIKIEKADEPAAASLRFTGKTEVLKPLASWQGLADSDPAPGDKFVRPVPYRLPWFHRSLAFGSGLAMIALIFLSAVFFGSYDPPAGPPVDTAGNPNDAVTDDRPKRTQRPPKRDIFAEQNPSPAADELPRVRSTAKPRPERHRVQPAAYRPRRQPRRQQPVTEFVPTTLVIYAENGQIKTRIEPRLAAVHKKPLTITN